MFEEPLSTGEHLWEAAKHVAAAPVLSLAYHTGLAGVIEDTTEALGLPMHMSTGLEALGAARDHLGAVFGGEQTDDA